MKIELSKEQIELLARINAPYYPDRDYDDDELIALEDAITDYVVMHEIVDNDTTMFGEELLDVHSFIVDKYDS
jgi:hypothetical protein